MTLKSNIKARNYREICKELDGFEFRPVRLSSMIILRILFTSIEKAKLAENICKEKQVQFCPVRFDDGHKQFHYIELFITGSAAFGIFDSGKYYSVSETTEIHKQEKKRKSDKTYKPYDNDYLGF